MPRLQIVATGILGGFTLGVLARAWMRLISTDPEFSWGGTLFIVFGFTVFGFTQSLVAVARRGTMRRSPLTAIRTVGAIGMVPLFGAAGALMFPTVVGGGVAYIRIDWHPLARVACLAVALGPVLFVAHDLVDSFGLSIRTAVGVAAMIAIYTTIIWATQFTFASQHDGWHLPRWAKITIPVSVALLFLTALFEGGLQ